MIVCVCLSFIAGPAAAANPYGVMLWPEPGEGIDLLLARARGLGVSWYRPPTVFVPRWRVGEPCRDCAAYARSGLALALTVRNGGEDGEPAHPPKDTVAYGRTINLILAAWKPSLLVVEGDEDNGASYAAGDLAADYGAELAAACAVAHARRVACTNGGLTERAAAALTWLGMLGEGHADEACDFARRALAGDALCAFTSAAAVPADTRTQLLRGADRLLALYRTAPIDAVNFHWFGTDARAFAQVADYLGRASGKPVLSNEIGQRRGAADPAAVRPLLRAALAAGLRVAIWYSIDTASTVSLFEPDGRLRQSGWEFQRQLSGLR